MRRARKFLKWLGFSALAIVVLGVLAFLGLFVATAGNHSVPDTVVIDPDLPQVTIGGATFHAETFGDPANPVVVVVHGGPGGDYGYLLNLHGLEDDYYVVFYDQRGAGLSPRVDASVLTLETSVGDLHRIVQHYGGGEPVNLIGHSWGAMLVAAYLGEYPEYAAKAVLAEPGELTRSAPDAFRERQARSRDLEYYRVLVPTIFESIHMEAQDDHARDDYIFDRMSRAFVVSDEASYLCAGEVTEVEPEVPVPPSRFGATAFRTLFGPNTDLSELNPLLKTLR